VNIIRRFFSVVLFVLIIPIFAVMAAVSAITVFVIALFAGLMALACFLWFGSLEDAFSEIMDAKTKIKKEES